MTEGHTYIGGTDVVLPNVEEALDHAAQSLDALIAAIKGRVECGVPFPVAERLIWAHPVAMQARYLCGEVAMRLYKPGGQPTADVIDEDNPF